MFGRKKRVVTEPGENCIRKIFIICSFLPHIIRVVKSSRMRRARHVYACIGKRGNSYRVLVGNPEGWRPVGQPRLEWKDNTEMYLKAIERAWPGVV